MEVRHRPALHVPLTPVVQGRLGAGWSGWVLQDPDDDKFIDAAVSSGVGIIVSGDRHLLALGTVEKIGSSTARQFLDRLADVSTDA
jgi:predicted nucleic acid-binding protein